MKTLPIENFLGSLDTSLSRESHYANALYDSAMYNWDKLTLVQIFQGIEKAYSQKKQQQKEKA